MAPSFKLSRFVVSAAAILIFSVALTLQTAASHQTVPSQEPKPNNAQPAYQSSTVLRATTRLVVVDVVATDGKGQAITDLKTEDFTVSEDGHPQQVRAFNFQHPNPMATPAGATAASLRAAPKLPDYIFTNAPSYQPDGPLNIVLVDALNTSRLNQTDAREQMVKVIAKLPTDRPIAIYALGSKLRLLQDFTSDPAALQAAIKNYGKESSALLFNSLGGPDSDVMGLKGLPPQLKEGAKNALKTETAQEDDARVGMTMGALTAIARHLAAYPGRKNLIWISETFPLTVDPDYSLVGAKGVGLARNYGLETAKTADALTNAQVAIYPVDVAGMVNSDVYRAGNDGYNRFGDKIGTDPSYFSNDLLAAHSTMNDLAERTGGKAFYNNNDVGKAIQSSMDDGSTYYSLAYTPSNKDWNGKFRKITIKVNRPGVKLRHRLGYFALDPQIYSKLDAKQRAQDFGLALGLDSPVSTALLFRVAVIPPSEKTNNRVLINYAIDPHAISFEQSDDGKQHATVDCAVQVYSTKGEAVKTGFNGVATALEPDNFKIVMQRFLPCSLTLDLPPGEYVLRAGVRDNRTGLIGTANATLSIAPSLAVVNPKPEEKKPR